MKTLLNRKLEESQRQEIFDMANSILEDMGGSFITRVKEALVEKLNEAGLRNDPKAYTAKDAMYQSFSEMQDNFKRTGKF